MAKHCSFDPCKTIISYSTSDFGEMMIDHDMCAVSPGNASDSNQETPNDMRNGRRLGKVESCVRHDYHVKNDVEDAKFSILGINAGGIGSFRTCGRTEFQKDQFFGGGDVVTTDAQVGDEEWSPLYQSARFGNFSYKFDNLEAGDYLIDLHFAEIEFTGGPSGLRIFDVFMQEEKVVSGIDIYAEVGPNRPFILHNLKASVTREEGLLIRFKGIVGVPIVSGISIKPSSGTNLHRHIVQNSKALLGKEREDADKENLKQGKCTGCRKLQRDYDSLFKELVEIKKALESVQEENELKSKEYHEASMSLRELQMELMRKSMHVGSLAFAVEGQVKEKSKWFSSLTDLSEKLRLLKLEHSRLLEEASGYSRCLTDMIHMTNSVQTTMDSYFDLERECKIVKQKLIAETKERKILYNKIVELKGNIRVFCRCRPLSSEETAEGASMAIDFEFAKDGELSVKAAHGAHKKAFKFDAVFSPEEDQEKVFERTSPLVTSVLDGYNVCIFAYGQTGTGKTFTMEGTEAARGVNYRTLEELFRIIKERQGQYLYEITVSVLEVYNEQIHDLLLSGSQPGMTAKRLEVRQVADGVHHVPGLVEARVNNMNEVWNALQTGSKARSVGLTNANERSSRSHCIVCVMVKGENLINGECTRSKLWLIDLAGSERVGKTDAQGERLKEAQNINRSLSALGDVVSALASKSPHIPFRNSKLTHLLQDSLGGDSKTLMFVQISPNENDIGETLCSLNFASRVRGIELGPAKKQVDASEIFRYKHMVEKIKQDNRNKDCQIKKMEEIAHSLDSKNKIKEQINKSLQEKIKELESQLLIERKLARQHVDTRIAENQLQQQQEAKVQSQIPSSPARILSEKHDNHEEFKEIGNVIRPPLFESVPPTDIFKCNSSLKDKENISKLSDEDSLPKKPSRASLCNAVNRIPISPATRRNSLIPVPYTRTLPPPLPLVMNTANLSPPPLLTPMPVEVGNSSHEPRNTRKINSILRRSLQKKVIIRSPMHQNIRRAGGTTDKLRTSIGGSGRKARRGTISEPARAEKLMLQKLKQKEKGWNNGTAVKNIC
ncbi:Minus-end-directed kinesin ATPase protein [Dioscorea alata]|uniref:Minus-end-directed kinesin ATPase protein n=1 Tax=Dioscorea alata TaxID=55571 RepID=A0ACB7UL99_DIOAL|nr:Minus-end-directed kinesin ATPase protein [Dioscorea alata]